MSAALVRESLELVESSEKKVKSKAKKDAKTLRKNKNNSGVSKRKLRKNVASSGSVQLTIDELRMRLRVHEDRTEGNVRMLQRLGERSELDEGTTHKIFERAVKGKIKSTQPEPKDEATAFTEEDFEKFEEEYFVT